MPTEEIFTAPLKTGIDGVVYSALPLVDSGNIIDKFHFIIRDGKIVEAHAEKGEEFLKAAISVDEGASYFGEVALVPYDSPISNQKILFYNTLFDENASCHLAFGEAYPECIRGRRVHDPGGAEGPRSELFRSPMWTSWWAPPTSPSWAPPTTAGRSPSLSTATLPSDAADLTRKRELYDRKTEI